MWHYGLKNDFTDVERRPTTSKDCASMAAKSSLVIFRLCFNRVTHGLGGDKRIVGLLRLWAGVLGPASSTQSVVSFSTFKVSAWGDFGSSQRRLGDTSNRSVSSTNGADGIQLDSINSAGSGDNEGQLIGPIDVRTAVVCPICVSLWLIRVSLTTSAGTVSCSLFMDRTTP